MKICSLAGKKIALVFIAALFSATGASAQQYYNASFIPEELKKDANVVKRFEEACFEISDIDRAEYKLHAVYTVLNREGNGSLSFVKLTNKYISLDDCDIRVYDATGKQLSHYKRKDLLKQAPADGLISEGMYNYLEIQALSYPITVDYNYTIKYTGTLFYPHYAIQEAGESVEQSSFLLKTIKDPGVRFKPYKTDISPEKTEDGKTITYKWSVNKLPAIKAETGSAEGYMTTPAIIFAPNKFAVYNSPGDMSTWQNFGRWEWELIKDLDELPEERKTFFRNLVKDAHSDAEKISIVYKYLQQNFRYVSIQLGIGGYRPFPAKFTDEKKYGDCKGLSFYTYSVLKSLGIKSYVALVNAQYNNVPVDPAFPCNNFNHMILCVPQPKDTIWLECTSNTSDFNYLGSFTENRYALLITENGGALVPTPVSQAAKNKICFTTKIDLSEDGSGKSSSLLLLKGDARQQYYDRITDKSDEQKKLIVDGLGFKQPDNFNLKKLDRENVEINLDIEKVPQFTSGNKMFLNPRINRFWWIVMPSAPMRRTDYFFYYAVDKTDSTIYQLPEGFTADALPRPADSKCAYATYRTSYVYDKNKNQVICTARLMLTKNRIPAAQYAEVKTFFDGVISDEGQKLVIRKN